jgi:hypothetical protein
MLKVHEYVLRLVFRAHLLLAMSLFLPGGPQWVINNKWEVIEHRVENNGLERLRKIRLMLVLQLRSRSTIIYRVDD